MLMKKIHLFILINLLGFMATKAQSVMELVRSPQIADMIRYDNTPVALNSGRLDLTIPLIGIEDKDFKFPVTANYNSTGFIPSKPETILGLNWSLALGGVIYREVKGIPDDIDDFDIKGFLHILKDKKYYNQQAILNNPEQYIGFAQTQFFKDTRIEANPDLYHFQFGEYSGTFSIGYDGKPVIVSEKGGNLKVDLSEYNSLNLSKTSIFKITTDNGYQYYFGGSKDNIEYSINYVDNVGHASTRIYPNAFFLFKIVATNGRELNISYKKIPSFYNDNPIRITYEENYQQELKNYTMNFNFTGFRNSTIATGTVSYNNGMWHVGNSFGSSANYVLTKIALVDEITCGDQKLKFNYSPRLAGNERFKNFTLTLSYRCGAMLDSINLFYKDKSIKNVKLQYKYYGQSNKAFFLTKLIMPDNSDYNFLYNKTDQLPDPMNADVDYWNFWRGGVQVNYPIPEIAIYENMDYKYNSDIRESNPEYCDVSLLKQVTFPTGGKASITYEPHLYSKKVDRTSASSFMPTVLELESDAIAGGARVSSISYSDMNNNVVKRVGYEYSNSKDNKRSSGILTYYPKYFEVIRYVVAQNTLIPINPPTVTYSNTGLNIPSYEQDHVRYSTVREVIIENILGGNSSHSSPVADFSTELTKMTTIRIEKGLGYWTITGMKPGGYVDIYIKQNGLTKESFRLNDDKTIRYIPNLTSGDYDIYYKKSTLYGFYIRINSPLIFEGPFKEVKFTDHITNPDHFQVDNIYCEIPGYTPFVYEINESRLAQNCSGERGKIISECSYDKNGNPFECTINTYSRNQQSLSNYTVNIHSYKGFLNQFFKRFYYYSQLCQTIHELYDRTGGTNKRLTTTNNFEYNEHNLLTKSISRNSKEKEEIDIVNYSGSIQNGIYPQMQERNMLNYPIEKAKIVNNEVVKSELFTYKKNEGNNDFVLDKVYKASLSSPLAYGDFVHFDGNSMDNHYGLPEVEYAEYDRNSNIKEYVEKDSKPTTCMWGYNKQYPIALFENARNDYKVTAKYKDVWTTKSIALKHNASYLNEKIYNFYTSKSGSVEFHLSGAMGYNWYVTGRLDDSRAVQLIQIRTSNRDEPWWRYENAYSYKVIIDGVSAGSHTFRIDATNSYKETGTAVNYDGELYYSYWQSESIAPEIAGSDDVFYENFEDYYGQVPFGFHSNKSYTGPYTVTLASNPLKNYKIDYQVFSDGRWNYKSDDFKNGSYTINEASNPIDEVRIYPTDAAASTFTYFPFIGLRSKTNERGVTESYDYDASGRLTAVRDGNDDIVKAFDYKFYNQTSEIIPNTYYSIELRRTFIKNDCDSLRGEIGQPVEYVIPREKYTSSISQEDANKKAYIDLISNGQRYANEHGECSDNIVVSVYNPYYLTYILEYIWGVQGSITEDYYEISPSEKIADTGDILKDYKPTIIYIPRRNYRNVRAYQEGDYSGHADLSIKSSDYNFNLLYTIDYYPDYRDTYVIGDYPFPR